MFKVNLEVANKQSAWGGGFPSRHRKPEQHAKRAPDSHAWEKQKNSTSVSILERRGSGANERQRGKQKVKFKQC